MAILEARGKELSHHREWEQAVTRLGNEPSGSRETVYLGQSKKDLVAAFVPGSTLLGYLNADHWAIAVPVAEAHPFIGRHFVDKNEYPRQAISEALLRYIEEDMESETQP